MTPPQQDHATTWGRIARDSSLKCSLLLRSEILHQIRMWFRERSFIEVDTPALAPWVGMEPHLVPLSTSVSSTQGNTLKLFHQTSPEYALKKLLAAGISDCFSLGHAFRDGETSPIHNPEFSLLEWYRVGADYTALMDDTANLAADIAERVTGSPHIVRDGKQINLTPPWERITVAEAMQRWAKVDIVTHRDDGSFREHARTQGHGWVRDESWDELFFKLFINDVEPKLGWPEPVILYDYPVRFGALARRSPENPDVAERFEAYVAGIELCNAFSELTDAAEQRSRLEREAEERVELGNERLPVDEDFLDALDGGFPECSGNALGVDRLVMLLAGEPSIERVTWFPFSVYEIWQHRHQRKL